MQSERGCLDDMDIFDDLCIIQDTGRPECRIGFGIHSVPRNGRRGPVCQVEGPLEENRRKARLSSFQAEIQAIFTAINEDKKK